MDQRIIDLYDEFVHVHFNRRLFLEKVAKVTGSMGAALALMPMLQSNYALATVVAPDDARVDTGRITFKGASGDVKAYRAKPKDEAKHGGIVVVHQNRGLNPHIEDIARRLAVEGYVVIAPDFLSQLGGTPPDEDAAMGMFPKLDNTKVTGDANAAVAYLLGRRDATGKVGATGFCWGGDVVNRIAVTNPKANAISVYYGVAPDLKLVPDIKAALLLNYADPKIDTRVGATVPPYEQALKDAHIKYNLYYYTGANHAFNDDTQSARYDEAAAKLAWQRTLALFKENVG
jgi:carboxymethylenebutenolidase